MRNILIATATVAMLSFGTVGTASAFLDNNSCKGNKNCNTTDNSVTNSGGQGGTGVGIGVGFGGQGGQGGQGGKGGKGGKGGNASATGGNAIQGQQQGIFGSGNSRNRNTNTNTNKAKANADAKASVKNSGNSSSKSGVKNSGNSKQAQGQGQGQSVNVEDNSVSTYTAAASSATAAALAASAGTCMGSSSAGAQGMSFGVSLGSTWQDADCNLRRFASMFIHMKQPSVAQALLCQNSDVAKAMKTAGTPCAADVQAAAADKAEKEAEAMETAWVNPDDSNDENQYPE